MRQRKVVYVTQNQKNVEVWNLCAQIGAGSEAGIQHCDHV